MHIGDQIEIRVIPNIFMKIAAIYNLRAAIRVSDFEHSRACYALTQMHGLSLLKFVAVAMLILANAFFVAAEFALVSIRDTRIEQMLAAHVPGARAVRRLQLGLDELLPAVQLGVTLCSLALGLAWRAARRLRADGLVWRAASRQYLRNMSPP
jgi:hypothetical protein